MSVHQEDTANCGGVPFFDELSPMTVAAHELKAPLALLRQLSLSLSSLELSHHERDEITHHMTLTSERALRLTSDLTKAQTLQLSLFEFEPVNAQQVCDEVVYELAPLYRAHGRKLMVTRRNHSLLTVANKDLLRRVMLNFADNALHYGDSDKPVELWTSLRNHGDTIRLGVRDYGPAIPVNIVSSLNSGNVKRNSVMQTRPQSSGLGLLIAKQFAEIMNGTIGTIRHRDGATFYVDMQASRQLSLL